MLNDPKKCHHNNLHPKRLDDVRTVCLDCESVVFVLTGSYTSALSRNEEFNATLTKLDQSDPLVDGSNLTRRQLGQALEMWAGGSVRSEGDLQAIIAALKGS